MIHTFVWVLAAVVLLAFPAGFLNSFLRSTSDPLFLRAENLKTRILNAMSDGVYAMVIAFFLAIWCVAVHAVFANLNGA